MTQTIAPPTRSLAESILLTEGDDPRHLTQAKIDAAAREAPPAAPAAATTEAPAPPPWWPEVWVGLLVEHWTGEDRPADPAPAIITAVRPNGRLALTVINRDSRWLNTTDKSSVPHALDPAKPNPHLSRYGKWDITPEEKTRRRQLVSLAGAIDNLAAAVATSQARVVDLEAKVESLVSQLS